MKKQFVAAGLALLVVGVSASAQFRVTETRKVDTGAGIGVYHPVFSPDGKKLLVSSENYDGLGIVDLEKPSYRQLSVDQGAGYLAAFADDGVTVVTRSIDPESQTMDILTIDTQTAQRKVLRSRAPHTNRLSLRRGTLNYADAGALKTMAVGTRLRTAALAPQKEDIFVTEEDLKIVVYRNGVGTVVDPLSTPDHDVNYCWTTLSPDKTKIAFVAGKNAYTCNLDGSNLTNLGDLRAPQWRDNDYVVGMNDADDGHVFTRSDIVIVRKDGSQYQQLTSRNGEIKMFPSVSSDGKRIAFHTTEGQVYIMSITEE